MADVYGVPVRKGSAVLVEIARRIAGITTASVAGGKLRESLYRMPISSEGDSALDGRFYVDVETSKRAETAQLGTGEVCHEAVILVQLGYYIGGGAGKSDRFTIAKRAIDDCQLVGDVVEDRLDDYDPEAGIYEIDYQGASRTLLSELRELHTLKFAVRWRSGVAR